jgi:hypothetical protein
MYYWTISERMGGTATVKALTFGEACAKAHMDPMKTTVIKVANA